MIAAGTATSVEIAPLIGLPLLAGLGGAALILLLAAARYQRRGIVWRLAATLAFVAALLNPSLKIEQRKPVPGVAVVVVDRSPSQNFGQRRARTDAALAYLKDKIRALPGLELRIVASDGGPARETLLFGKLDETLADVPASRRAGIVLLTDGEVHDVPGDARLFGQYGPVNLLLSGEHKEHDRQLVVREAPAYGIVGQSVQIAYRINDPDAARGTLLPLTIHQDNVAPQTIGVPANTDQTLSVPVAHAGQNVVDLNAGAAAGELTLANNRVPVIINGVRDRLRVLLVSGQPYAGGRTWRNLLTSDSGVDLVHFTIMRDPQKFDPTPQNDLSLIAFPFDELFKEKLYSFDLIIFDRYRSNRILPDYYFANIARYVQDGGALLVTDGPEPVEQSLYQTSLAQILSAPPSGRVIEQAFKPQLTDVGSRHPVAQGLGSPDGSGWGSWLRQVAVTPADGDEVVMTGADKLPLLILSHVGKGRVAELASDEIWLWSRGYEGGGPQAELLRRLAHWLMKEPELEENALTVTTGDGSLLIRRHSLDAKPLNVTITAPDGQHSQAVLRPDADGLLGVTVPAPQLGVYVINDGMQERFALAGALNPPELSDVLTTDSVLKPLVHVSGGAVNWLVDMPNPDVQLLSTGHRTFGGKGWIGFRDSGSYVVTGMRGRPLLPAWLVMGGLLTLLAAAWWREDGR